MISTLLLITNVAGLFTLSTSFVVPRKQQHQQHTYDRNSIDVDQHHGLTTTTTPTTTTPPANMGRKRVMIYSSPSSAISNNQDMIPGIAAIDEANDLITEQMHNLRQTPYFRLFCVDILASCEYMPQELFECYSETCEVYPVDDEEVRFVIFFIEEKKK